MVVMKAKPYEDKTFARHIGFPCYLQPKYDGNRCTVECTANKTPIIRSSSGREIHSMRHINKALTQIRKTPEDYSIVLDGEIYKHDMPCEEISGYCKRQYFSEEHKKLSLVVFDLISNEPQSLRLAKLSGLLCVNSTHIITAPTHKVHDMKKVESLLTMYMSLGYEGIILRAIHGLYQCKKVGHVLKIKPRGVDYYEIVGYKEEYDIHGAPKGRLGSFVCHSNSDGKGLPFAIGSGSLLDANGRTELWKIRDELLGRYLEVKYQNLTSSGVPRGGSVCTNIMSKEQIPEEH